MTERPAVVDAAALQRLMDRSGRHDAAERRKTVRRGRERGCHFYIPAVALAATGFDPYGPEPYFRLWAGPRGRIVVQLYREK